MTGLRALYVQPTFTTRINELNQDESRSVLDYLFRVQHENHENHVKYKWNKHDLAIWDNQVSEPPSPRRRFLPLEARRD